MQSMDKRQKKTLFQFMRGGRSSIKSNYDLSNYYTKFTRPGSAEPTAKRQIYDNTLASFIGFRIAVVLAYIQNT